MIRTVDQDLFDSSDVHRVGVDGYRLNLKHFGSVTVTKV